MSRVRSIAEEIEFVQMRCRWFGILAAGWGVLALGVTAGYWISKGWPSTAGVLLICGYWWLSGLSFGGFLEIRRERDVLRRLAPDAKLREEFHD